MKDLADPWRSDRVGILEWIARQEADSALEALPDEETVIASHTGLKFAPGVFDQMMQIHEQPDGAERHARDLHHTLKRLATNATDTNLRSFYETVTRHAIRDTLEPFMARIAQDQSLDVGRVREVGRWLAQRAPDRDAVKLGIAILHATRCSSEMETLVTLARHEEFGLYAVPAIAELHANPHRVLFELAQRQQYWGKVYLVKHLDGATDPEIRDWLITEGWRTTVGDHSAALVCARTGGLWERIRDAEVSPETVIAAGEIIIGLFMSESMKDGPGISQYEDGAAVVERYLELLERGPLEIRHWRQLRLIRGFLEDEERHVVGGQGWNRGLRKELEARARALLERPDWESLAIRAMEGDDWDLRRAGSWVAERLKLDTWPYWFRWVEDGSNQHWVGVFATRDPDRFAKVLALVDERLDLAALGSGPTTDIAPMRAADDGETQLGSILAALRHFPGLGWKHIATGLRSRYIRTRERAVVAISRWPAKSWPSDAEAALRRTLQEEPDAELRALIRRALKGEALKDQYDEPPLFD